tara:strand:+ start:4409 stop:4819 length:411 start_codon:yes stop_codon:yes gene_type:complete
MKYYKSETGEVSAYEADGSQDAYIKPDLVRMTDAEVQAHLNPVRILTAEDFMADIQSHMDTTAKAYGYDDIKSAVTYAEEPSVPKFQIEGRAFRAWRSQVWDYGYTQLALVESGERAQPTIEEILAELPVFEVIYE